MAERLHRRANSRRLDIKDLLNDDTRKRRRRGSDEDAATKDVQTKHLGLLTKTMVTSPEVRSIFNAQLRHRALNDLVFVKDDEVEVYGIQSDGGLRLVASRERFACNIRCAAVIGQRPEYDNDSNGLEVEKLHLISDQSSSAESSSPKRPDSNLPPHILVLVLDCGEIRFLVSESYSRPGRPPRFFESVLPLPRPVESLETPGAHIAADPFDRAIAVAAHYGNIVLFKVKPRQQLQQGFDNDPHHWQVVCEDHIISVDAAIVKITFLYPEKGNQRQVLLLVVAKITGNRLKLFVYEWDHQNHVRTVQARVKGIRVAPEIRLPQLIIPGIYSPHFIWVTNQDVFCFEGVLNGSPRPIRMERSIACEHPRHWARSDRLPVYTQWARAHRYHPTWRGAGHDELFLAREDGIMHQIKRDGDIYTMSKAGNIHYNSSTAFTTFLVNREDFAQNDHFIFSGDQCPGEVCRIGYEAPPEKGQHATRASVMSLRRLKRLPNWSSVLGATLVPANSDAFSQASDRQNLVFTSGLQPYGALSELRRGLKARIEQSAQLPFDLIELKAANGLWCLQDKEMNTVVFISVPGRTEIFGLLSHGDVPVASFEEDPDVHGVETLLAARTPHGHFVQVTEKAVCLLRDPRFHPPEQDEGGDMVVFGSFSKWHLQGSNDPDEERGKHSRNRHAAFDPYNNILAYVTEPVTGENYVLHACGFPREDEERSPWSFSFESQKLPGGSQPTCLAAIKFDGASLFAVGFSNGQIELYVACQGQGPLQHTGTLSGAGVRSGSSINSIAMLHSSKSAKDDYHISILVGSRTGVLEVLETETTVTYETEPQKTDDAVVEVTKAYKSVEVRSQRQHVRLGSQPIKLQSCESANPRPSIIATCENDVLEISLPTNASVGSGLNISSIWFWDDSDHSTAQPQLSALSYSYSPFMHLDDSPMIVGLAGSDLHFTTLSNDIQTLPRRRPLEDPLYEEKGGTPRIATYCPKSDMIVVATSVWSHNPPSQFMSPVAPYKGTRAAHAALCFLPARLQDKSSPVDMETVPVYPLSKNEKIMGMINWTFQETEFLILGLATVKDRAEPGGRLMFLKLRGVDGVNVDVEVAKNASLKDPVRSIAELSSSPSMSTSKETSNKVVIGVGKDLSVYEFTADRKWREICKQQLRSPAVQISCKSPYIYVSTEHHSIQVWRFALIETPNFQTYTLELVSSDDKSAQSSCHITIDLKEVAIPGTLKKETRPSPSEITSQQDGLSNTLILSADLQGRIKGIVPANENARKNADVRILFETTLRQPMTHLVRGNIRPPWRKIQHAGALIDNIVGCGIDGSFYSMVVVDVPSRTLLKYLENLVNWAKSQDKVLRGVEALRDEPITIDPARDARLPDSQRPSHYHINGDMLNRFIQGSEGEKELSRLLAKEHNEDDANERYRGNIRATRVPRFIELVKEVCVSDLVEVTDRETVTSARGGQDAELTEQEAIRVCIRWLQDMLQPIL